MAIQDGRETPRRDYAALEMDSRGRSVRGDVPAASVGLAQVDGLRGDVALLKMIGLEMPNEKIKLPFKFRVTREDIDSGMPLEPNLCPIALQLRKLHKKATIEVGYIYIQIGTQYFVTPRSAKNFIHNFDIGQKMRPKTITIKERKKGYSEK